MPFREHSELWERSQDALFQHNTPRHTAARR